MTKNIVRQEHRTELGEFFSEPRTERAVCCISGMMHSKKNWNRAFVQSIDECRRGKWFSEAVISKIQRHQIYHFEKFVYTIHSLLGVLIKINC
jgi:hypothetical protein